MMDKIKFHIFPFLFFILSWEVFSFSVDSDFFPSLIDISKNLYNQILHEDFLTHLLITLKRVFIAFFITFVLGSVIGILMGIFKFLDRLLDIFVIIGLNIPALVVIVLCYIWFGLSDFAVVIAVVINKLPIVITNIKEGTKAFDQKWEQLATVYHFPLKDMIFKIYLPQLYPYLLATARLILSLIWKIVLVVELLGRSDGVGFLISTYYQYFDIMSIISASFGFILLVLVIEYLVLVPIEKKITRWRR